MPRRRELFLLLPLVAILAYWQWRYIGYVKDDTFISMRYARNLALGHGMVFNYGDKLEGYTNFLWVILTTPAFWLDVNPLHWVKAMSCFFGQLGLVVTYVTARYLVGGSRGPVYAWLAAAFWACSPSVILWSTAGLEPTLMAVLASGGTYFAMRAWGVGDETPRDPGRDALLSALLLLLAALCRPDAHAVLLVAGAFVVLDVLQKGRIERHWLLWAGIILGVLAPYHLGRYLYFGDLLPNTAYVKAGAGPEVWGRGVQFVKSLLQFASNPVLFAAAGLGLLLPGRRTAKVWAAGLTVVFLLYMVKIGRDEMKWFRLFLPVFPLLLALAGAGLGGLLAVPAGRPRIHPIVGVLLALGLSIPVLQLSWDLAESKARWHSNYVAWSEKSFRAMGRYVQERSAPGDTIVFQDMGAAPFSGPELRWVDSIGILDRFVAHELARQKLNPFMRSERRSVPGGREAVKEADRNIKNYLFDQEPEWFAFVAYVPKPQRSRFNRKYKKIRRDKEALEQHFYKRIRGNTHAHGVPKDRRFRSDYRFERIWKRNQGYWLVLYRHKDH